MSKKTLKIKKTSTFFSDLARAKSKNQLFLKPYKNRLVKSIIEIQNQLRRTRVFL